LYQHIKTIFVSTGPESSSAELQALRDAVSDKDQELMKLTAEIDALTHQSADKDSELASLSAELKTAKSDTRSASRNRKASRKNSKNNNGDVERESGAPQKIVEVRDAEIKRLERGAEELRRVLSKAKEENQILEEQLRARSGTPYICQSAMHSLVFRAERQKLGQEAE
jgi:chromosome segregation ATPase